MFRIVHPRSPRAASGTLLFLVPWTYAIWIVFRDTPSVMAFMFALSLGLAALVVFVAMHGPVVWEVDQIGIRKKVRDRTRVEIPLREVRTVQVTRLRAPAGSVILAVFGMAPRKTIFLDLEDAGSLDSIRAFYEACCFYLLPYGASRINPFGWRPVQPAEPERMFKQEAHWGEAALAIVSQICLLSGINITFSGTELVPWRIALVIALMIVGCLALAAAIVHAWRRVGFPPLRRKERRDEGV